MSTDAPRPAPLPKAVGAARRIKAPSPEPSAQNTPQRAPPRQPSSQQSFQQAEPGRRAPPRPPAGPRSAPSEARTPTARRPGPEASQADNRQPTRRPPPVRTPKPPPEPEVLPGVRLAKRVADLAACSRAQAEHLIESGRVTVDGVMVQDPPARVLDHQEVEVAGSGPAKPIAPATLLLHKPAGIDSAGQLRLLVAERHMAKDRSGLTLLKKHLANLVCITPIEPAASGLVVWSQHAGIQRKLVEDASLVEHEAIAEVRGEVSPQALKRLNESSVIDGRAMQAAKVSINHTSPETTRLRVAYKGYHPGQTLQLCEQAGLELTALKRMRIGRLPLAALPEGQWRFLLGYERF